MISMFRFLFVIAYSQYGAILNDKQRNKYIIYFFLFIIIINGANIFTGIIFYESTE